MGFSHFRPGVNRPILPYMRWLDVQHAVLLLIVLVLMLMIEWLLEFNVGSPVTRNSSGQIRLSHPSRTSKMRGWHLMTPKLRVTLA
jgi:hypothetical protein